MIIKGLTVGPIMANCFILGCKETKEAAVIDPGDEADRILMTLAESALTVKAIINTHGHFDHVSANKKLKEATGADILATICTGCQQSFAPLSHRYPFEVRSYIDIVAEAVGVKHEDRFKKYLNMGDISQVMDAAREYIDASDFSQEEMERVLHGYFDRLSDPGKE